MPWVTNEWPVTQSDFVVATGGAANEPRIPYCQHEGCHEVASVRFTSSWRVVGDDGKPDRHESKIRSTLRCQAHAGPLRLDVASKTGQAVISSPGADAPATQPPEAPKPKRAPLVYEIPAGTPIAACRSCGAGIHWVTTAAGKSMPVDAYDPTKGQPHWGTCPNAKQHKKART